MDSQSMELGTQVGAYISEARDVVQIVFFLTIALITVLTYLKAKRTILQPLRTEVFKEQIKLLSDVLRLFVGKGEHDLRNSWGLSEMLDGNASFMLDEYARIFFGVKVDWNKRPYGKPHFTGAIIAKNSKQVQVLEGHLQSNVPPEDIRPKELVWAEYVHDWLHLPSRWSEADHELLKLVHSPLIPVELASMLEEYRRTVNENVSAIRNALTESAKEVPEKYPDLGTLNKAAFYWIYERCKRVPLEPKAKAIIGFARRYLDSDNLTKF